MCTDFTRAELSKKKRTEFASINEDKITSEVFISPHEES